MLIIIRRIRTRCPDRRFDGGTDEMHIGADGKTYLIIVDQNISWSNLPPGLTKLLQDMHLVVAAIR